MKTGDNIIEAYGLQGAVHGPYTEAYRNKIIQQQALREKAFKAEIEVIDRLQNSSNRSAIHKHQVNAVAKN